MGGFGETLRQLGPLRLSLLGAVAVGLLGFFFFFSMRLSQPPMGLLYSDLAPQDAAQITARLEQQQIPFELRNGGNTIMVPDYRVLRLRLSFAETGIPRGGSIGYEIFDRGEALGQTNFMQQLNQVRALEGELARTISALQPVQNARVHLALPRASAFVRDRRKATASVMLQLFAGRRLEPGQVQAIVHLVASSVPDLEAGDVTVVDQNGTLLITETANNGAQGSYNPQPFRLDGKVVPYDGMAIGWNTSNSFPTPQTEWMTRLAFRNTSQGNFGGQTLGRHNLVNNAIMADGSLRHISAPDAKVKIQRGRPSGIWNVEATFYPLFYEEGAAEAAPSP